MDDEKTRDRSRPDRPQGAAAPPKKRGGRRWVDDAADARSSDDTRARTPHDATGQPSTQPFDE